MKKYPIGASRLARSASEGFTLEGGELTGSESVSGCRIIFFGCLDSNQRDCQWGRFRFKSELTGDAIPIVRAFATNDPEYSEGQAKRGYDALLLGRDVPVVDKLRLYENAGCSRFMAANDMLLYKQSGRYLWICVEIVGAGCAKLSGFEVFSPRDNFLGTFPEIYRQDAEFFHRYLSIFSSLYYDIQEVIDSLDHYVDVDKTPYEALPILASWLGLELEGGFLDDAALRALVKSAFGFLRNKGTRETVEGILKIFPNEPFHIVEQRAAATGLTGAEKRVAERLYGNSPFDVTILLLRSADERLHAELKFLLQQFLLLRGRLNLVFAKQDSRLDSYSYMDVNARVANPRVGALDGSAGLDGLTYIN
jgi:phage tail-like protein